LAAEIVAFLSPAAGDDPASMRPRPIGRGNHDIGMQADIAETSFNEAAANWPRKWPT